MKNFLLALPFLFVVLSAASGAEGEALDTPWAQAILPQALSEQQLLVTAAAAGDITSLVLRHIANVTASLTEEYLKGLVALGTEVLLTNGSANLLTPQVNLEADSLPDGKFSARETGNPAHSTHESAVHKAPTGQEESAQQVVQLVPALALLPPSWSSLSVDPLDSTCVLPCNCNNNPQGCCIKICGRTMATVDRQASTPIVTPSESGSNALASKCVLPCNCNNNPQGCCIKICGRAMAVVEGQTEDVGTMVVIQTADGSHLAVDAKSDLRLYASFVSKNLVQKLGLSAEVHSSAINETPVVVINEGAHQVVGTVPITVQAYTRKNIAFEDVFYVIEPSKVTAAEVAPELVFGIDHVRQAEGLSLNQDLFD